jgi:hypothetical protein
VSRNPLANPIAQNIDQKITQNNFQSHISESASLTLVRHNPLLRIGTVENSKNRLVASGPTSATIAGTWNDSALVTVGSQHQFRSCLDHRHGLDVFQALKASTLTPSQKPANRMVVCNPGVDRSAALPLAKHFREAGHNYSFSASVFSEFDVLVQAKEVLRVVLLLDGHEPIVVGPERGYA